MPNVDVFDLNNQKVGAVELADEVFAAPVNEHCSTKPCATTWPASAAERPRPRRGTKFPARARSCGVRRARARARMGSIRSPLWRHGGTVHGPQPRDYSYNLPRKMMLGALRCGLDGETAGRRTEGGPGVHARRSQDADHGRRCWPRSRRRKTVLLVEAGENRNLSLGARNLPGVKLVASRMSTCTICWATSGC